MRLGPQFSFLPTAFVDDGTDKVVHVGINLRFGR
jgi:hypothetical protein